ncbi:flagellar basal body rod protein FlgC [Extibacter muris]|uniref:flagellar basal body rod protein FlgC n=1 Tax=Extibacter muris TaxID=1796622 RepID=UPI001D05F3DF|nr:flagellar basal body rod protein FlgC [Extibacter muris]MCB6201396.1 flagellar basal body rod protein FlgC [Extibacter muris]MCQ4662722.1 flagellar basal body rod protein FlgC [Extibacter muris]MCQ4694163.1 flagellar basal body rod protein FlgC [Extibacter muris]
MSFLSSLNISASGLTAQRLRLDIASENIANIETTRTEEGTPYRRKMVVLEAREDNFQTVLNRAMDGKNRTSQGGVAAAAIVDDDTELKAVYDPEHPDADDNGYVMMPNVDMIKETTDAMSATRSYEANITAFNAVKLMAQKALEIGK